MAEAGPPTPPIQSQALQQPQQPVQPPIAPDQPVPTQQAQHVPHQIWSDFKPEFSGKPEQDAEAHLLRINDWMDTHQFQESVKVQRFCLTVVGEARLWYESLRPINVDWLVIQNQFRQQYSKIGNTTEQLFHVWHSFHFDENSETLDT